MLKNNKLKYLSILLCLSFILGSFLAVIHYCCFDQNFYTKQHNELTLYGKSIAEHIGISDDELKELTFFVLDYLNHPDASLDKQMFINGELREVFTDDEKAHMVDVRDLNLKAFNLCIVCIVIFIICLIVYIKKNNGYLLLFNTYKKCLLFTLLFFSILASWILIDFDSFWTCFHKLFFVGNDLWILNLHKDILIMIVPPDFFNALVIRIVVMFVIVIIVAFVLLYLRTYKVRKND